MATNYPGSLDTTGGNLKNTWADADTTATAHPAAHNNLADAVIAIETELGTTPKGTFTNVAARLAARTTVRLTADSSGFTTTTLANLTGMSFSVAASTDYWFRFVIPVTLGMACGVGAAITCPASPTSIYYRMAVSNVTATTETLAFGFASAATITTAASATTNAIVWLEGTLANGANAGTLQVQLKRGSGGTGVNVVAKKGAFGEMYVN